MTPHLLVPVVILLACLPAGAADPPPAAYEGLLSEMRSADARRVAREPAEQ